jgi:hypothetical protein
LRKSIDQFAPDALRYFVDIRTVSYASTGPSVEQWVVAIKEFGPSRVVVGPLCAAQ